MAELSEATRSPGRARPTVPTAPFSDPTTHRWPRKKMTPEAEPSASGRRQHGRPRADRGGRSLRRGGRDSTVARACRATGETVLAPARNRWSRVSRITGHTGKSADGETVAVRLAVARKRSNARGAKEPCCTASLGQHGRQG